MGVKITSASLSKGYYYGEFLQHKPGFECTFTDMTEEEALDELERRLDAWHDKRMGLNPNGVLPIQSPAIRVISLDAERIEIEIDNALTVGALSLLKEQASYHGLVSQYMKRLKELTHADNNK